MERKLSFLYEINTRVWLRMLSEKYSTSITLGNIPEKEIAALKALNFDAVWLMGIWAMSAYGRNLVLNDKKTLDAFAGLLPGMKEEDIRSSPYAVAGYEIDATLGSRADLAALRETLRGHGIKLIVDFVPNHLAVDHPWIKQHPEYFIQGSTDDLRDHPGTYFSLTDTGTVYAHGKDPFFPAWIDAAQLNFYNPELRRAMRDVLVDISSLCDGVRCDMAMLILNAIQKNLWGERMYAGGAFKDPDDEFWPAAIEEVRSAHPAFIFIAEVYWGFEETLLGCGFDYAYDKPFYDALRDSDIKSLKFFIREQTPQAAKRLRFIENHDEERAASLFGREKSKAAAFMVTITRGGRLYHQGQLEGLKQKLPLQLLRQPNEKKDRELFLFYTNLLTKVDGISIEEWSAIEPEAAEADDTSYKTVIALSGRGPDARYLAIINYSDLAACCSLPVGPGPQAHTVPTFHNVLDDSAFSLDTASLELAPYAFYLLRFP